MIKKSKHLLALNVEKVSQLDGDAKGTFNAYTLKPGHMLVNFATSDSRKRYTAKCMNAYTQMKGHMPVDFVTRNSSLAIVSEIMK